MRGGVCQFVHRVKTDNARTGAADIGFHHNRKTQAVCRFWGRARVVQDTRARGRQAQFVEQGQLRGLAGFVGVGRPAVDNRRFRCLHVREQGVRVERPRMGRTQAGGRTHAIEEQRVMAFGVGRVKRMGVAVHHDTGRAAPGEFR